MSLLFALSIATTAQPYYYDQAQTNGEDPDQYANQNDQNGIQDPNAGQNNPNAGGENVPCDLQVTKTASPERLSPGEVITYQIFVGNNGQGAARDVQVRDALPEGCIFVNAEATKGGYDQGSVVWSLGELSAGESASLTMVVTADTSGQKTNTAEATTSSNDLDPSNNAASATTIVQEASVDLQVIKSATPASACIGENIKYTLNVTNVGKTKAKDGTI